MRYTNDAVRALAVRETERTLSAIWGDLLDTDVGPHDDFFDLGGFSLLAVDVVSAARRSGPTMRVEDVFEHRTATALASAVLPDPAADPAAPDLELSWYDSPGTVPIMLDPRVAERVSAALSRPGGAS